MTGFKLATKWVGQKGTGFPSALKLKPRCVCDSIMEKGQSFSCWEETVTPLAAKMAAVRHIGRIQVL